MEKKKTSYSSEDHKTLFNCLEEGKSLEEIIEIMKRPHNSIINKLNTIKNNSTEYEKYDWDKYQDKIKELTNEHYKKYRGHGSEKDKKKRSYGFIETD